MKRKLYLFICIVIVSSFFSNGIYSLDTAYLQKVKTEEQNAYTEINEGKVKEGLRRLVQLFREAPLDDAQYIEPLLGPFQLFCYTSSRHDWVLRTLSEGGIRDTEPLLEPSVYPIDRLLLTGAYTMKAPVDMMSKAQMYSNLSKLINSEENMPHVVGIGLGLLTFPEKQEVMGISTDFYRILSVPYMRTSNTVVQQMFVEIQVLQQLRELIEAVKGLECKGNMDCIGREIQKWSKEGKTALLGKMKEWGITSEEVLTLSPGLNSISVGLPTMDLKDMSRETFKLWSDMLKNSTDSRIRYMLLSFLKLGLCFEDIREEIGSVLEDLIKEPGSIMTMEGIYAHCILADWDIQRHRAKELYFRSKELIQTGVLPGVFSPRSLYEEREKVLRSAYNYFVKLCWYEYAVELGGHLKMPNWMDIEIFKREPLFISMKMIKEETAGLRFREKEEELKNYYLEIAEHTPNAELKSEMMSLTKEPLRDIAPRTRNNTPPPVGDIMMDRIREEITKKASK